MPRATEPDTSNPLRATARAAGRRARARRAELFRRLFPIDSETRILDLGSSHGSHLATVLAGTAARPDHVTIADIDRRAVESGAARFGFQPVVIPEDGELPFPPRHFDVVFSSSVIEHVTLPKEEIWRERSTRAFRERSWVRQRRFADEIRRLGTAYFVQTPNKWFPIESHTLLPFAGWLPRPLLLPLMRISNRVWIKTTQPDWNLLTARQMAELFPDATIARERFAGLTKSLMAYRPRPAAKADGTK